MDKRIIAIFRVVIVAILSFVFGLPLLEPFKLECSVAEFYFGDNNSNLRAMWPVQLTMFVYLLLASIYIVQTFLYLRIGSAMNGKDSSIIRFFKLSLKALQEFPDNSSPSTGEKHENIERVLRYRDGKLANMGVADAADYMKGTGHIDHMLTRSDLPQAQKSLDYLNGRLGNMGNDDAVEFLRGGKTDKH